MRRGFARKLALSHLLVAASTCLVFGLSVGWLGANDADRARGEAMDTALRRGSERWRIGGPVEIETIAGLARLDTPWLLTVWHADGTLAATARSDAMPDEIRRVLEGVSRGAPSAAERIRRIETPQATVGGRVGTWVGPSGDIVIAHLAAIETPVAIRERARTRAILISGFLAALTAVGLGTLLVQGVVRPIRTLESSILSAEGEFGIAPSSEKGMDEIERLGSALRRSARRVHERVVSAQEERNKLRATIDSMVEGLVAIDRDEIIVQMNSAAGELLGLDVDGATLRPLRESIRQPTLCDLLNSALVEEKAQHGEFVHRGPYDERSIEIRCAPLRGGESRCVGAVAVLHDVTALRHLSRVRQDFVANVSHEFATPVAAILGMAETLQDDPDLEPSLRSRFLERIIAQCQRLSRMVQDLLILSRLESGDLDDQSEILDLRDAISESYDLLQDLAADRGVVTSRSLPEFAVSVQATPEAIRQILDNLITNGIKYTPSGGRVHVSLESTGVYARIRVKDTGVGIEPEHQDRIFERFYRVDRARSRLVGGTGLGLAIVKHRVQALGGRISLVSAPGLGSTFEVELPLAPGES